MDVFKISDRNRFALHEWSTELRWRVFEAEMSEDVDLAQELEELRQSAESRALGGGVDTVLVIEKVGGG